MEIIGSARGEGARSGDVAFWDIQPLLARTAAQAGQFDTAFSISDVILKPTSAASINYNDAAATLVEIIKEAKRANRPDVRAVALERLKGLQENVPGVHRQKVAGEAVRP